MDPVNSGASVSAKQLVHDIDLTIQTPDGVVYLGNGGATKDTVNNVEMVQIDSPSSGIYKVMITAGALLASKQSQVVSLVITCGGLIRPETHEPTSAPTTPTRIPTIAPSVPTVIPTIQPSIPTVSPSSIPTSPSAVPSSRPTSPTVPPHVVPTSLPTTHPSMRPSRRPVSRRPSSRPSTKPTMKPTRIPTLFNPTKSPVIALNITKFSQYNRNDEYVPYISNFYLYIAGGGIVILLGVILICLIRCCCCQPPKKSKKRVPKREKYQEDQEEEGKMSPSGAAANSAYDFAYRNHFEEEYLDARPPGIPAPVTDSPYANIDRFFADNDNVPTVSVYDIYHPPQEESCPASDTRPRSASERVTMDDVYGENENDEIPPVNRFTL